MFVRTENILFVKSSTRLNPIPVCESGPLGLLCPFSATGTASCSLSLAGLSLPPAVFLN